MIPYIGDEHRRALGLGLSGAHRTGKTVVAQIIAEANDWPLILSSGTQVAKDMGIKVDAGMPMDLRLDFQDEVLKRFTKVYDEQAGNGCFIADRTPLDFAAYALTDWHATRSTPELDERLMDYVARCMEATGRYFFMVSVIQPGIPYVQDEGKPAPNKLYQEYLNTVLIGLAADFKVKSNFHLMPRSILDRHERAEQAAGVFGNKINQYLEYVHEVLPRSH